MHPLLHTLGWFTLAGVAAALSWLYGSSWRAVARALGEAEQRASQDSSGTETRRTRLAA